MEYTKKCPKCGKDLVYKNKGSLVRSEKAKTICRSCSAKEVIRPPERIEHFVNFCRKKNTSGAENGFYGKTHKEESKAKLRTVDKSYTKTPSFRRKMSAVTSGFNNPMYGTTPYDKWVSKFGKAKADELEKIRRAKLSAAASGEKNSMYGKPTPQGSGNGWSGWYKDFYFRSLKELSYVVELDKKGVEWVPAKTRINYTNWDGTKRTYTPDFLVGNQLVEIKPTKLHSSKIVQLKQQAAERHCAENGLVYVITDPDYLPIEEIVTLRNSKLLKFTKRYEQMFLQRTNHG